MNVGGLSLNSILQVVRLMLWVLAIVFRFIQVLLIYLGRLEIYASVTCSLELITNGVGFVISETPVRDRWLRYLDLHDFVCGLS